MMHIMINTYACGPGQGSEPGMAWRWVSGIARFHHVYVITDNEFQTEIEEEMLAFPYASNVHLYYNPVPERVREMCRNQGDYRFYYFYKKWQKKSYHIAEDIVGKNRIDIIHHLNLICFREPGYLWRIKGIPYVWGPIGGMNIVPLKYLSDMPLKVRAKYLFKNCANKLQTRYDQRVNKAAERSDIMLAANGEAFGILRNRYSEKKVLLMNEAGCEIDSRPFVEKSQDKTFDILWVGRFLPTKLLGLALEVISEIKELHNIRFHIIGSSVNQDAIDYYKNRAAQLEISGICEWHGLISHDEVQRMMVSSKLLLFTSVSEGTPHVVMEAIANRLPVVCFDMCGQGDVVTEEIGCKISLSSPPKSIKDFADIIRKLHHDRLLLDEKSRNCEKVIDKLSWDGKVKMMLDIYKKLVDESKSKERY